MPTSTQAPLFSHGVKAMPPADNPIPDKPKGLFGSAVPARAASSIAKSSIPDSEQSVLNNTPASVSPAGKSAGLFGAGVKKINVEDVVQLPLEQPAAVVSPPKPKKEEHSPMFENGKKPLDARIMSALDIHCKGLTVAQAYDIRDMLVAGSAASHFDDFKTEMGQENSYLADELGMLTTQWTNLNIEEVVKASQDFLAGKTGFLGFGKKSKEEIVGMLDSVLVVKPTYYNKLTGMVERSTLFMQRITFFVDNLTKLSIEALASCPEVPDVSSLIAFLIPMQSTALITGNQAETLKKSVIRSFDLIESIKFHQLPAHRG